jgi:hypothetical protein
MPMPVITIKKMKDGRPVASFRDDLGRRVRTSVGVIGGGWVNAEKVKAVAQYGIELQLAQLDAGLGSDGSPMPALKGGGAAQFSRRVNGRAVFARVPYAQAKVRLGLQPIRDLLGPGIGGHMRDDIRINYLDDKQATISITTRLSRIKALANEQRAAWWGWTAASVAAMAAMAREVYDQGLADYLVSLGIMSANAVAGMKRSVLRRAA